jgi:Spy/CpxP family protein refolding chaperone
MTRTRSSRTVAAALLLAAAGSLAAGLASAPAGQSPQATKGSRVIWHHGGHVYSGPLLPASKLDTPAHRL